MFQDTNQFLGVRGAPLAQHDCVEPGSTSGTDFDHLQKRKSQLIISKARIVLWPTYWTCQGMLEVVWVSPAQQDTLFIGKRYEA